MYMQYKQSVAIVAAFILGFTSCRSGDQEDLTPFEKPEPLFVVQSADTAQLFKDILGTVNSFGFTITRNNNKEGVIEAFRRTRNEYDKIIIWMERNFSEPLKYVKVYFSFGRFIGPHRIKIDSIEEDKHVGMLKNSLMALSNMR
jgi:hypothetical protein